MATAATAAHGVGDLLAPGERAEFVTALARRLQEADRGVVDGDGVRPQRAGRVARLEHPRLRLQPGHLEGERGPALADEPEPSRRDPRVDVVDQPGLLDAGEDLLGAPQAAPRQMDCLHLLGGEHAVLAQRGDDLGSCLGQANGRGRRRVATLLIGAAIGARTGTATRAPVMPVAPRCGIEPLRSQRGGDSDGAESEGRERRGGNDREQHRGGEFALHVPTLMQRRDVGKTPSRETAQPSAFAAVGPRRELKGWTKGRTQSWSKGWTQSEPSTSTHREMRRAWSPTRADLGRNSGQDLHAPWTSSAREGSQIALRRCP